MKRTFINPAKGLLALVLAYKKIPDYLLRSQITKKNNLNSLKITANHTKIDYENFLERNILTTNMDINSLLFQKQIEIANLDILSALS